MNMLDNQKEIQNFLSRIVDCNLEGGFHTYLSCFQLKKKSAVKISALYIYPHQTGEKGINNEL